MTASVRGAVALLILLHLAACGSTPGNPPTHQVWEIGGIGRWERTSQPPPAQITNEMPAGSCWRATFYASDGSTISTSPTKNGTGTVVVPEGTASVIMSSTKCPTEDSPGPPGQSPTGTGSSLTSGVIQGALPRGAPYVVYLDLTPDTADVLAGSVVRRAALRVQATSFDQASGLVKDIVESNADTPVPQGAQVIGFVESRLIGTNLVLSSLGGTEIESLLATLDGITIIDLSSGLNVSPVQHATGWHEIKSTLPASAIQAGSQIEVFQQLKGQPQVTYTLEF